MTRRGFFGHAAGAYALVTIAGAAAMPTMLHMLIARHRTATAAFADASQADDERSTDETAIRLDARWSEMRAAETDILSMRPATLEEAGERFAYLVAPGGPWHGCVPEEEQVMMLVASMLPEVA